MQRMATDSNKPVVKVVRLRKVANHSNLICRELSFLSIIVYGYVLKVTSLSEIHSKIVTDGITEP